MTSEKLRLFYNKGPSYKVNVMLEFDALFKLKLKTKMIYNIDRLKYFCSQEDEIFLCQSWQQYQEASLVMCLHQWHWSATDWCHLSAISSQHHHSDYTHRSIFPPPPPLLIY